MHRWFHANGDGHETLLDADLLSAMPVDVGQVSQITKQHDANTNAAWHRALSDTAALVERLIMTINQAQWAEQHDWHIRTVERGSEYAVIVRDVVVNNDGSLTTFYLMFQNCNALKTWAGY